jgi:hypothetical protein
MKWLPPGSAFLAAFALGLISLVPNVFPVFVTLGFMGLAGYYLDVITISFAAVIIGVAVDDTIHFFTRFRQEFAHRSNYPEALKRTLASVGRPITFVQLPRTSATRMPPRPWMP